jgi:HEAT repeat protein
MLREPYLINYQPVAYVMPPATQIWWKSAGIIIYINSEISEMKLEELLENIRSPYAHRRVEAAAELGKLGDRRAFDALVESLKDSDNTVRDNAAFALGELGLKEAAPHIERLLGDKDEWVRKGAVKALGMLKSSSSVNRLVDALVADPAFIVRRAAVRSLGQIGSTGAIESLRKALYDKNVTVRDMAKQVLAEMGEEV